MHICLGGPGFLLSENWPPLVQRGSLVSSIGLYRCIPLPLSDWKQVVAGSGVAAAITGHLDFSTQPSAFLGLRKRPLTALRSLHPLRMNIQNVSDVVPSPVKTGSRVESEDSFLSCLGF